MQPAERAADSSIVTPDLNIDCRPLTRAGIFLLIVLGFRYAPPQATCCRLLRRLGWEPANEMYSRHTWEVEVDQAKYMLGELMASSLLEWNETSDRYRLHDLARLFADAKLSAEERMVGQKRFATHYEDVLAAANKLYKEAASRC